MMNNLTREKVASFLMDYKDDEYKILFDDNNCRKYEDLPDFAKGTLFGLQLARIAVMNADLVELEERD